MERQARLQGILHISQKPLLSGSPVKEPFLKVPFIESLAERCPTTRALLHSSIKVPSIRAPHTRFPSDGKGTPWREMPVSGDFLNISSRVPSEGAPPQAPFTEPLQRETLHPQSPLHQSLRRALLQVSQTEPLWKEMPVSRAFSTYPSGSPVREPSLQVPFTELPWSETHQLHSPFQSYFKVPGR